jgi:DNA gyrase subunit A
VKLINIKGNDSIAAVTKVMKDDEEELKIEDGEEHTNDSSDEESDDSTATQEAPDAE